jgi:endo-alpha-1,4-polygalactosaminidase (GH114 family)
VTSALLSARRARLLALAVVFTVNGCRGAAGLDELTKPPQNGVTPIATEVTQTAPPRSSIPAASPTRTPRQGDIWHPEPGATWQWQLTGEIDTTIDVEMYDVDLFDTPASTMASLRAGGFIVVCYLSAGTYEPWRPDADTFRPEDLGRALDDWPDERWLDTRSEAVRRSVLARFDLAVARGCDGVEPDNIDGYQNDSDIDLTHADAVGFLRLLAREAHARGLSIGLKNALDLVPELVGEFDWALNEECLAYDECGALRPFLRAVKAVFHVEYVDDPDDLARRASEICHERAIEGLSTLVKTWELGAQRASCY